MSARDAFDVAVIGGGLVGAAIAFGLRSLGARLAVVDEGDVAHRAARGNFGLIWVQGKGMSPKGRPEGEYRSAQHEGSPVSAPGRPKREYRSAQHEGSPVIAPGRPKREYRSAQHEGSPVIATA